MYCGLNGVYKAYGKNSVMENFSCEIEKNKITVFFGNSGCGKTTLIKLLLSLEKADSGKVVVPDVTKSVVFQEDRVLNWLTVRENIEAVLDNPDRRKEEIDRALALVKLNCFSENYPNELSGGMRRRLALARALVYNGELFILDEPFKGLDAELKSEIIPHIKKLKADRTVILITHDIQEAELLGDRIYFMKGPPLTITDIID